VGDKFGFINLVTNVAETQGFAAPQASGVVLSGVTCRVTFCLRESRCPTVSIIDSAVFRSLFDTVCVCLCSAQPAWPAS